MIPVTIIGSRETPRPNLEELASIAQLFPSLLYISGGAHGADTWGVRYATHKLIFIPFNGFNKLYHNGTNVIDPETLPTHLTARAIAKKIPPQMA